jgi:hypothetical protein
MTAEPGCRISSDATFFVAQPPGRIWGQFSLQALSGAHSASRPYLGFIQPPGLIWGSFNLQALSGAHSASRPYLGLIQYPGRIWGLFSLQAMSGAHSASRPYVGPIHSPFQCVPGDLFLGVKGLRYEAEKSCQFSAKVKNTWSFISAPPCVVMASCLIRHRDSRTFSLLQATVFVTSRAGREVVTTTVFLNFQLFLNVTRCQLLKSLRIFGRR